MERCELPLGLTALACAIAEQIQDDDELALTSAILVQLGDNLALIAAQRAVCAAAGSPNKQEEMRTAVHSV